MLTLGTAGNTIQGVTTAAATAITYTFFGDEFTSGTTDSFKVLAQGQLPTSVTALYTVPATTQTIVKAMQLFNTTGAIVNFTLYVNGAVAANSIGSINIPANGTAIWESNGWTVRDVNGATFTTANLTLTGDVTGSGSGAIATTLATVTTGATVGDASHVAQMTYNAKGLTTSSTAVPIAITSAAVSGLTFFATLANLSGDVTTAGSGVTTLATVNSNLGTFGGPATYVSPTVNAKGLITAITSGPIAITSTQVSGLGPLATATNLSGDVTTAGSGVTTLATVNANVGTFASATYNAKGLATAAASLSGDATTSGSVLTLATVNAITGPVGGSANSAVLSFDVKGRVASISSAAIQIAEGAVTNLTTDLAARALTSTTVTATAPLTGSGTLGAAITLGIPAATPSANGYMTSAFANTVTNLWYDVTNYGVSISNSGAANVAAMNTLIQTTAPSSARFFFPATGANYPMTGTITVTQNYQRFIGAGQINSVLFCGNTTANLFQINDSVAGVEFHDLGIWSTATATAGAVFSVGTVSGVGCQQTSFFNIGLQGFGGNFFNGVVFNGSRGGEVSFVDGCVFNSFLGWGVAVVGNTTTPTSTAELTINQTVMNGQVGASFALAGIYVQQAGAVNVTDCSIILCTNNMLVSPLTSVAQIVASVLCENTFFDSAEGSCVKFSGVGAIVRCKFTACYFTLAAAAPSNSASFEFSNTAANAPAGIDFVNCSFLNTFGNANTTFGMLLSNVADVQIINPKVSGWTTGISVTPVTPAGSTRVQIIGGVVGPAGGIKGNGTGILLNAGSTTYGLVQVHGVSFPAASAFGAANTTQITDSSTIVAGGSKTIALNNGLVVTGRPANVAATALPLTTATSMDSLGGFPLPAGVRPGTVVRATALITSAATAQQATFRLLFGTNNTNTDAPVFTAVALSTGTAALGLAKVVFEFSLLTATTAVGNMTVFNNGTTGVTAANVTSQGSAGPITVATTSPTFIGIYGSSATAAALTVRSVTWEVVSQ